MRLRVILISVGTLMVTQSLDMLMRRVSGMTPRQHGGDAASRRLRSVELTSTVNNLSDRSCLASCCHGARGAQGCRRSVMGGLAYHF